MDAPSSPPSPLILPPPTHVRLRNRASGPEICYFGGLSGNLLRQNPLEKVGGFARLRKLSGRKHTTTPCLGSDEQA